jgi:hypothetical protein
MRHPVRNRRIDGVLRDIAPHAEVIVARRIFGERTALHFHLVRGLPSARHDLPDTPHGL